jgi:hypothetical protein
MTEVDEHDYDDATIGIVYWKGDMDDLRNDRRLARSLGLGDPCD